MNVESAGQFIYRNARPLEFARWRYLFENGTQEEVLRILAAYQNEDGGFGHGLEPDCWNMVSSPIQTWAATEIVREVGLKDAAHPIMRGILRYLGSASDFNGHIWLQTISSNNDCPHAPWWSYVPSQKPIYNPTASLAGFILKYAGRERELFVTGVRLAKEAYAFLFIHSKDSPFYPQNKELCNFAGNLSKKSLWTFLTSWNKHPHGHNHADAYLSGGAAALPVR